MWNKYYLDHIYENGIVRAVTGPIAKAAYWVNQNVLDGVVNGAGLGSKATAKWVYRNVDQRVVDGAVNNRVGGPGAPVGVAPVQSGRSTSTEHCCSARRPSVPSSSSS
ncbi:MAG: hypothetical protein R2705_13665 [Ilumatobacteraceae bacterium]